MGVYIINNEKVDDLMRENKIEFEKFDTPLDAFSHEEAIYRTNNYEEENKKKLTIEARDAMEGCIEDSLLNNNFLNDDYLCDLVQEGLDEALEYCETKQFKVFMTRDEE